MPFLLIRNDITKVRADVVVNPANPELQEGDGTSRAIYLAAGEEKLREACEKIGRCDLGKAVITEGFGLSAKYIIHTVGPVWRGGGCGEEKILYSAYVEALKLAEAYGAESIAFPLLSAGSYGYPKTCALQVAVSAISNFLLEHDMLVYMVLYDRNSVMVSKKLFQSVEEYIDDYYVDLNEERYRPGGMNLTSRRLQMPMPTAVPAPPSASATPAGAPVPPSASPAPTAVPALPSASPAPVGMPAPSSVSPVPAPSLEPSKKQRKLEDIMKHMGETFSQMLLRLIDERGYTDAQVYRRANIDRRHFSKIRNNADYAPNKKTAVAFAIALELSLDEAEDLLKTAGFSFSDSSKFDVIIRFFLENGIYDVFEINEILFAYDQPLIGG